MAKELSPEIEQATLQRAIDEVYRLTEKYTIPVVLNAVSEFKQQQLEPKTRHTVERRVRALADRLQELMTEHGQAIFDSARVVADALYTAQRDYDDEAHSARISERFEQNQIRRQQDIERLTSPQGSSTDESRPPTS